ncbi:MAG: hypothetical protein ACFFF4_05685 [Candidatus Thorarchaeota archaeon]
MTMISFSLPISDLDELLEFISKIPEFWNKAKGFRFWGVSLKETQKVIRETYTPKSIIIEWVLNWWEGAPSVTAMFLVDEQTEGFLSCPKKIVDCIKKAFIVASEDFQIHIDIHEMSEDKPYWFN